MRARLVSTVLVAGIATLACGDDDDPTGAAMTALTFTANLAGDAERPTPVVSTASGTASLGATTGTSTVYNPGSGEVTHLTYSVTVAELSGAATAAHIHGPADENTAAGVIVPLTVTSTDTTGLIINGSFTSTGNPAVSMDSLITLLRAGQAYINIHTAANPDGEIRGQVRLQSGQFALLQGKNP